MKRRRNKKKICGSLRGEPQILLFAPHKNKPHLTVQMPEVFIFTQYKQKQLNNFLL